MPGPEKPIAGSFFMCLVALVWYILSVVPHGRHTRVHCCCGNAYFFYDTQVVEEEEVGWTGSMVAAKS